MLPPPSGLFNVTVDPSMGWAGLKTDLASCPEGGSVLFKEGEYVYEEADLEFVPNRDGLQVTEDDVMQQGYDDRERAEPPSSSPPPSTSSGSGRPPSSRPTAS